MNKNYHSGILASFVLGAVLAVLPCHVAGAEEGGIQRLTWAGVKWVEGDTTVLIDAVATDLWDGNAPQGFVPATADTRRRYAVVTHAHNDHFDVKGLKDVLGERGYVICHESIATYIASRGLRVIPVKSYEPVMRGGFVFTPVPAEDGFGDHQVSWVITNDRRRIFHAGDTLWHGQWKAIGLQYGPFDAAFLPINGARGEGAEVPAVLTPLQAVEAASLLRAQLLVPIHFGLNDPPYYVEVDEPLRNLEKHATRRGVAVQQLLPGEFLQLDQD